MNEKVDLIDCCMKWVEVYEKEMVEDDCVVDEVCESVWFVKDYWGIDIDEFQLKNEYYDKFVDVIIYDEVVCFFDIEEFFCSCMVCVVLVNVVLMMIYFEFIMIVYKIEKEFFDNWKSINIDGEVGFDYIFIYDGLIKLMDYVDVMVIIEGIEVDNFEQCKFDILNIVDKLIKNWIFIKYVDWIKKVFMYIIVMIRDIELEVGVYMVFS